MNYPEERQRRIRTALSEAADVPLTIAETGAMIAEGGGACRGGARGDQHDGGGDR